MTCPTDAVDGRVAAAPLGAVQSLAFISSIGTATITNGVYFLARQACGFSDTENFALGTMLGLLYIPGAAFVGPLCRRLAGPGRPLSTRVVLAGLIVLMSVAACLPVLATAISGPGRAGAWGVWLCVAIYSPLSGAFWPIVESYLSGGRSGAALRGAVGRFNIVWSSAVVAAAWAMAPGLERAPLVILAVFAGFQLLGLLCAWRMGREPGEHIAEHHEPHPPAYHALLGAFRILLPTSYFVLSAWSPYAPRALEDLGVAVAWHTPLAGAWMLSRVAVFAIMERWHGWHGRWTPAIVGAFSLGGGFALGVMAPVLGESGAVVFVAGLAAMGVGMAIIYAAALYYVLEVGKAEIDAGGSHEALIGVGFVSGPACGLAVSGLVGAGLVPGGWSSSGWNRVLMLALVGVVLVGVGVATLRRVVRELARARAGRTGERAGT